MKVYYFWLCLLNCPVSIALSLNTTTNYRFYRYSDFTLDLTNWIYATLRGPGKTWKKLLIICFSETFWWWCSYPTGFRSSHEACKFSVAWLLRDGAWESVAVPTLPYRHFSLLWQCVAGLPGVGYCVAHKHCLLIGSLTAFENETPAELHSAPSSVPSSNRENTPEKKRRLCLRRDLLEKKKSLNGCISVNNPVSTLK